VNHACVCAANGNAVCTAGRSCCPGGCSDLKVEKNNCGSCGHTCTPDQICKNGSCICLPDCSGKPCGPDGCGGICENQCFGAAPICDGDICVPCSAEHPCPDGCCQADGTCDVTCRVFASSTLQTGDFGGLSEGDAICQDLAEAVGLPGMFMAWLSDGTDSPSTRFPLAGSSTVGPYALVGAPFATIADNWQDLITCEGVACLDVALARTEVGGSVVTNAWTATTTDGTSVSETCVQWTSADNNHQGLTGHAVDHDSRWTNSISQACSISFHLYCFQQG
jgi:hypothetical protein